MFQFAISFLHKKVKLFENMRRFYMESEIEQKKIDRRSK
jgi:hypothetical protein